MAKRVYGDMTTPQDQALGYQNAGQYNYGEQKGYGDEDEVWHGFAAPAFVQVDIPTSSSNYSRPRTVAAGYDPQRKTLTVVFRDGTFYNYYEVTQTEWNSFYASFSKGKHFLNHKNSKQSYEGIFLSKPRGDADVSTVDPQIRAALYRVSRTNQVVRNQISREKIAQRNPKPRRRIPGQNTATANKPKKP